MSGKLLRLRQIIGDRQKGTEGRINVSKSKFYLMIKEGVMPMPTKLGSRTSVWPEDEIQSAIDAVVAGRFANIRDLVKGVQP